MSKQVTVNGTPYEVFETKRLINNWEQYTGRYRVTVSRSEGVCFCLPGRGGKVTLQAAREIARRWQAGESAGRIVQHTGWALAY